jgi:succinate-acetate transporter protein
MTRSSPAAPADDPLVEQATRIVLRPIANPLPLGFIALATGTLLLSALQLEWLRPAEAPTVALVLLAFVAPLQLMASVFGLLARNAVAGTAMGILAGTWLSISLAVRDRPTAPTSRTLGLLLLVAATAILIPAAGSAFGKLIATAVLTVTALRFAVTGIYEWTDDETWMHAAGVIGLLLCALALYAALAMLIEDVRRTTTLPTLRRARGRASIEGNLRDQLGQLEHEAGVREQL